MLKVNVGGVEGDKPWEQHALSMCGLVSKVVTIKETATLCGVSMEVHIERNTTECGRGGGARSSGG